MATQLLNRLNNALTALAVSVDPADRLVLQLEMQRNNHRRLRTRGGCQGCDRTGHSKPQHLRGAGLVAVVTSRNQTAPHNLHPASLKPATGSRHMPDTNSYFFHTNYHASHDYLFSKHLVIGSDSMLRFAGLRISQLNLALDALSAQQFCGSA